MLNLNESGNAMPTDDVFVIPIMGPQQYLGGMAALNVPSPQGTGDWHMLNTFFRPKRSRLPLAFISGMGCELNTSHVLGNIGIFDCTAVLDQCGIRHADVIVFAANHTRAIVDLVLFAAARGRPATEYLRVDDFMSTDAEKQSVYDLLDMAIPMLPLAQRQKALEWKAYQQYLQEKEVSEGEEIRCRYGPPKPESIAQQQRDAEEREYLGRVGFDPIN